MVKSGNVSLPFRRILITGGAGFIGSRLAIHIRQIAPTCEVVVLDNLTRKGSSLNLGLLQDHGVEFIKGDIRNSADLAPIDGDLIIACAAEPSVMAGINSSPRYVIETNLLGTLQSLEWARERGAAIYFFSSSRIYPLNHVGSIPVFEGETRFEWNAEESNFKKHLGRDGIKLGFPTDGVKSMYGTTKLSSEDLIREYAHSYDLPSMITRFGVVSGAGQMGQAQQGVLAFWAGKHFFEQSLVYKGFGGAGKQVRDFLPIEDLCALVVKQLGQVPESRAVLYQAAGGRDFSVSLMELTKICQEVTGNKVLINSVAESHQNDLPILMLDSSTARRDFDWEPTITARDLVGRIYEWLVSNESALRPIFCGS